MLRLLFLLTFIFHTIFTLKAQIIGDNQLGSPVPKEIGRETQSAGALQGNVNLFDGTYNSTYPLGTVAEPTGLSFTLNMSYQSSIMTGGQLPLTEGIPYGSGWNVGVPMITVSSEDFNNYSQKDKELAFNGLNFYPRYCSTANPCFSGPDICTGGDKGKTEGVIQWFAPQLSIPGVASGRMVLKEARQNEWTFVLNEFEQPIEAKFDGRNWEVKLPNGIEYRFLGAVSHRSATAQRMEYDCIEETLRNYAAPKSEMTSWYCSVIRDRNKAGVIRFEYNTYGRLDYNKVLSFDEDNNYSLWNYYSKELLKANGSLPKPFIAAKDVFLKKVSSSIESLDLEYEVADFFNTGHDLINPADAATNDDIQVVDDLYTKKRVYKKGNNINFNGWHRYRHGKEVNVDNEITATNPYEYYGFQNQLIMNKQDVGNDVTPAFAHGYLESDRITSGIVPGDTYELTMTIDPHCSLPTHFLDVNIATGGRVEAISNIPLPVHDLPGSIIDAKDYKRRHGESIYSTFSKPVKYVMNYNKSGKAVKIQEYFTMPARPAAYEGFNIQVGPAISDHEFNTEPLTNYNGGTPNICTNYFNVKYSPNQSGLPLYPTSPMPQNFGIGLPSYQIKEIWRPYLGGELNYCSTGLYPYAPDRYWWNKVPTLEWPHRPTATRSEGYCEKETNTQFAELELMNVELHRITKNPLVLKRVLKKRWQAPNVAPSNNYSNIIGTSYDDVISNFKLVSALELDYELEKDSRYLSLAKGYLTPNSPDIFSESIGDRNVILLTGIQQLPKDYATGAYAGDYSEFPAFKFGYGEYNNDYDHVYSDIEFLGSTAGTQKLKQNYFILDEIFSPLGGEEKINYQIPDGIQSGSKGYYKTYFHQEYPRLTTNSNLGNEFNRLSDRNTAKLRVWIVDNIEKYTDTYKAKETYLFSNFNVKFDGPYYDWSNESFRKFNSTAGFKNANKSILFIDDGVSRNMSEETIFYTNESDRHFFGKVKNHVVKDASGEIISTSENTYEAVLAYEALHRRKHFSAGETFYTDYKSFFKLKDVDHYRPLLEEFNSFEEYRDSLDGWDIRYFMNPNEEVSELCCPKEYFPAICSDGVYNEIDHPYSYWKCEEPKFDDFLVRNNITYPSNLTDECYNAYRMWGDDPDWSCVGDNNQLFQSSDPIFQAINYFSDLQAVWAANRPKSNNYAVPNPVMFADHGHIGAGHEYYELDAGKRIDAIDPTYLNSYFIKKIKEESCTYEKDCSIPIKGSPQVVPVCTTTTYEYFDANYAGYSDSEGYDKLYDHGEPGITYCLDATMPTANDDPDAKRTRGLFYEPSFQLFRVTSKNTDFPSDYTIQENFYYWDLANDPKYHREADVSTCLPFDEGAVDHRIDDQENYMLWKMVNLDNNRSLPFEKRTTIFRTGEAAVVQSEFYEYTTSAQEIISDIEIIDLEDPYGEVEDCENGDDIFHDGYHPDGVVFDNRGLPCVFYKSMESPGSPYNCAHEELLFYWCNCDYDVDQDNGFTGGGNSSSSSTTNDLPSQPTQQVGYDINNEYNIHDYYDGPGKRPNFTLKGKTVPKAIYRRLDNPVDPNTVRVPEFTTVNGAMAFNFDTWEVLKTEEILKRSSIGLPVETIDARDIITRFNFPTTQMLRFEYCDEGTIRLAQIYLTDEVGLPESITVGDQRPDAQTTTYTYFPDGKIESITDPNGVVITAEYDQLNRLVKEYRNGILLSEVEYSNYKHDQSPFDQFRMQANYQLTTTHFDNNLNLKNWNYIDVNGSPVGSVIQASGQNSIVNSNTKNTADGLIVESRKPYLGFFPLRDFNVPVQDKMSTAYESDARKRPLKSSKYGNSINGIHIVENKYCYQSRNDIIQLLNAAGHSIIPNGNHFSYKYTTDEDGKSSKEIYNHRGELVAQLTNNDQFATVFEYDRLGNVKRTINPELQSTTYSYNHWGLLYEKDGVDKAVSKYAYDNTGILLAEYNPTGYALVYKYDDYGRMIGQYRVTDKLGNVDDHPIFDNKGLFFLLGGGMGPYDELLDDAIPEKTWRYNNIQPSTTFFFNPIGQDYLNYSFENALGKIAQTTSYNENGDAIELIVYSYNDEGFPKWEMHKFNYNGLRNNNLQAQEIRIDFTEYGRQGNLITKNVDLSNDRFVDMQYHYKFDEYNRLASVYAQNKNEIENNLVASYNYDDLNGLITEKRFHAQPNGCNAGEIDEITYSYDNQYRLTNQQSNLFSYTLNYDGNVNPGFADNWNGNINNVISRFKIENATNPDNVPTSTLTYDYKYDGQNRLTNAHATFDGNSSIFGHAAYWYDKIGNLQYLQRGERNANNVDEIKKWIYDYQSGTNRLRKLGTCIVPGSNVHQLGNCEPTFHSLAFDNGGNLVYEQRKGLTQFRYVRANLPVAMNKLGTGRIPQRIGYEYNAADSRIFKKEVNGINVTSQLEYYLRDASGQELGIYDFLTNRWTWYIHGVTREAKTGIPEFGGGGEGGGEGEGGPKGRIRNSRHTTESEVITTLNFNPLLKNSLAEFNPGEQQEELDVQLLLVEANDQELLGSLTQLDALEIEYTIIETINISNPLTRFALASPTGDTMLISMEEIFNTLPIVAAATINYPPTSDPFDIPLSSIPGIALPNFYFYIYDHLGNTRVVFHPESCSKGNPVVGLKIEYAADYYPYGKVLREFSDGPTERFLTTGHERDEETEFDYRGARYYDAEYGRFLSVDPLADVYPSLSPYNYVAGNPIIYTDPDGRNPIRAAIALFKASKRAYKAYKKGKKFNPKDFIKDELFDIYDNGKTLVSPESSLLDRALAIGELISGVELGSLSPKKRKKVLKNLEKAQNNILDSIEDAAVVVEKKGKRRKNRIPDVGPPNTSASNKAGTTVKKYGPDGNVQKEFNKGHGKGAPKNEQNDHIHDYKPNPNNPSGRGDRQKGRKPKKNEMKKDFDPDERA